MISNELIEEIIYISNKDKYIDKKLLLEVTLDVIKKLDRVSKKKFNGVKYNDTNYNWAGATWSPKEGIISLNYDTIMESAESCGEGNVLTTNLNAILYPLHEIEHLRENYKALKNNLELELMKISSLDLIESLIDKKYCKKHRDEKYDDFVFNYHDIIPNERIAEVDAYKNLLNSLDNYPDFTIKYNVSCEDMLAEYFSSLIMEYNDDYTNSPFFKYLIQLQKIGYKIDLDNINLLYKLNKIESTVDKLKYGAKVNKEEVENLRQKILKI